MINFVFVIIIRFLFVYCRELAPGTVSLTGDRAKGDDSKQDSHYNHRDTTPVLCVYVVKQR